MIYSPAKVYEELGIFCLHSNLYPLKLELRRALKRRLKRIKGAILRLENELEACRGWAFKEREAHLLQSVYGKVKKGERSVEVIDWETDDTLAISLDPSLTLQEEVSKRYKAAKKLRKGIPHIELMLLKTLGSLRSMEILERRIPYAASEDDLEHLRKLCGLSEKQPLPSEKKAQKATKPYFEFISEANIPIWVGRNAKNNDLLTFQHSNGLDTWLHVSEYPGSHVVIKTPKGSEPDPETLKDGIELALHYSKAKDLDTAEIVITLKKHVTRFGRNQPGKVQVAQPRHMVVKREPARLKRLMDGREGRTRLP